MTANDPARPGPYYHGTRADLRPGDLIAPGFHSNYGARNPLLGLHGRHAGGAVWVPSGAGDGRERIYVVEPTGPIEDDPNLTDKRSPATDAVLPLA
jgi:rifampin ADP-ribosylating transferase